MLELVLSVTPFERVVTVVQRLFDELANRVVELCFGSDNSDPTSHRVLSIANARVARIQDFSNLIDVAEFGAFVRFAAGSFVLLNDIALLCQIAQLLRFHNLDESLDLDIFQDPKIVVLQARVEMFAALVYL